MTSTRTTRSTITFAHLFTLAGAGERPAGTYAVETEEELLPTSMIAYRRVATWLRMPGALGSMRTTEVVRVEPDELTRLLASDAATTAACEADTLAHPERRIAAAPREERRYQSWIADNATDLTWAGLVVAGVVLSGLLAPR